MSDPYVSVDLSEEFGCPEPGPDILLSPSTVKVDPQELTIDWALVGTNFKDLTKAIDQINEAFKQQAITVREATTSLLKLGNVKWPQ